MGRKTLCTDKTTSVKQNVSHILGLFGVALKRISEFPFGCNKSQWFDYCTDQTKCLI